MSWLSYCYKTYQNSVSEIGKQQPGKVPLLPVAHTTQQVNIEVELDKDGNFQYAGLLAQDQRTTIIPCTEESSARTSGMVPHPLVDKLQYIAADYPLLVVVKNPDGRFTTSSYKRGVHLLMPTRLCVQSCTTWKKNA